MIVYNVPVFLCLCVYVQDCGFINSDMTEEVTVAAVDGNDLYVCLCFRQYCSLNLFLIQLNGVLAQRLRDIEMSLKGVSGCISLWKLQPETRTVIPTKISAGISFVTNAVSLEAVLNLMFV